MPRAKKNATSANADAVDKKPMKRRAAAAKKPTDESEEDELKTTVKRAVKNAADKPKKTIKRAANKSESEDESDDEPKKAPPKRAAKKAESESDNESDEKPKKGPAKRASKKAKSNSEDDEYDDDPKKAAPKQAVKKAESKAKNDKPKKAPAKKAAKKVESESEDEESDDEPKKAPPKRAAKKSESNEDESDDELKKAAPKRATKKSADGTKKAPVKSAAGKGKDTNSNGPKAKQAKSNGKTEGSETREEPKLKAVIIKGKAPVDPECEAKVGCAHVYCGDDGDVFDAMLNQTNVMNNNNKYYICQLLEDDDAKSYSVWFRWGRVGKKGQCSLSICGSDLNKAKSIFTKKFSEKTRNNWDTKDNFVKVSGKYDLLKMDYNTEDVVKEEMIMKKPEKKRGIESLLEPNLKNLMELIFNIRAMEQTVVEMKYDANKSPLGKLTTEQIKAGYTALKKIEDCVSKDDFGSKLIEACDEFYTRIPHDFGMKRPPLIKTLQEVHAKVELLETLGDIEIAMKLLREELKTDEHPVDRHYKSLNCNLKSLDKSHPDYKMIEQYLQNTHGSTHNQYKLELVNVFECDRATEKENYRDVGNRMLLWHGSRLANFAGILKQGLRIAPPEAPVTGYMFDKGVYFADMSSKSANYCFTNRTNPLGLLLLCEVSLGTQNKLLASNYNASRMPVGHHSVMGLGRVAPDPKDNMILSDGTVVPYGKGTNTNVQNPGGYTLEYNEYIIYDTKQVRLRYLLQTQFKY